MDFLAVFFRFPIPFSYIIYMNSNDLIDAVYNQAVEKDPLIQEVEGEFFGFLFSLDKKTLIQYGEHPESSIVAFKANSLQGRRSK